MITKHWVYQVYGNEKWYDLYSVPFSTDKGEQENILETLEDIRKRNALGATYRIIKRTITVEESEDIISDSPDWHTNIRIQRRTASGKEWYNICTRQQHDSNQVSSLYKYYAEGQVDLVRVVEEKIKIISMFKDITDHYSIEVT